MISLFAQDFHFISIFTLARGVFVWWKLRESVSSRLPARDRVFSAYLKQNSEEEVESAPSESNKAVLHLATLYELTVNTYCVSVIKIGLQMNLPSWYYGGANRVIFKAAFSLDKLKYENCIFLNKGEELSAICSKSVALFLQLPPPILSDLFKSRPLLFWDCLVKRALINLRTLYGSNDLG